MKEWKINKKYQDFRSVLSDLLESRGIIAESQNEFLNPPNVNHYVEKFSDQFKQDLIKARDMVLKAVRDQRPIFIHGDYDADGVCATAILFKTVNEVLNHEKVFYFLPNRFEHGYGLSEQSFLAIAHHRDTDFSGQRGLLITVDCGITAEEHVINLAKQENFEVLITDHHQKRESLPTADCVLWNDQMVGAGISLILAMSLGMKNKQLACLAGIATVTDLAKLQGFNRSLVKMSLEVLNNDPPIAIKYLLEAAGRPTKEITTYDLGYIIGPRLNAAGRLESATAAIDLLTTKDLSTVQVLAKKLNDINLQRQSITQSMTEVALKEFSTTTLLPKILISASKEYHEGVIGLIAGKLVQKYYRPTIVLSVSEDLAKGSGRSISGVNIIELLRKLDIQFESLGGHPMAAGFSFKTEYLDDFKNKLLLLAGNNIENTLFSEVLEIDLELPINVVDKKFIESIEALKPYGVGNREPIFCTRNLGFVSKSLVGKTSNHLILRLTDGNVEHKAVYFDYCGDEDFVLGKSFDIVYNVKLGNFNGSEQLDFILRDLRPST